MRRDSEVCDAYQAGWEGAGDGRAVLEVIKSDEGGYQGEGTFAYTIAAQGTCFFAPAQDCKALRMDCQSWRLGVA